MSSEEIIQRRGFDNWIKQNRHATVRPPVMRGRRSETGLDVNQLPIRQSLQLRSPSGEMFFLTNYSMVGGPDIVRP